MSHIGKSGLPRRDTLLVLDHFVRSQNKWHMTSMLFAEMLKEAGVDPSKVDKIFEAAKDEVAHMLIEYRRGKQ